MKWPDEATRKFLLERADEDEEEDCREAAMEALAENWPDETTRMFLAERAIEYGSVLPTLGKMHSEFGRIVFTKDLDGIGPYLDPAKPVLHEHIERAAKKARVPHGKIEEHVRSLSAHMGWDITRGVKLGSD